MSYVVKEIFYTLQGEGAQTGRPAVFCRFAGCNLWSGREADRARAICSFCDTDFVGIDGTAGGRYSTPEALADRVAAHWPRLGLRQPESRRRARRQTWRRAQDRCAASRLRSARFRPTRLPAIFCSADGRGPDRARNTEFAMEFCRAHPQWQLSLQTHKLVGFR